MAAANGKFASLYFKDAAVKKGLQQEAGKRGMRFNGLAVEVLAQALRQMRKRGARGRVRTLKVVVP